MREWPVWLKVTTPVLAAVIVAILAGTFAFGNIRPARERAESDQQHAQRICDRYAQEHRIDGNSVNASSIRVRDLKQVGLQFKVDISPWNRYPNNHFIANCSFFSVPDLTQLTHLDATTPTTRCPNGDIVVVLPQTKQQPNVYVDDQGHSSPDPLVDLRSPLDDLGPCAGIQRK